MKRVSVELIPDPEFGGYTARVPDIPAYGEGETEQEAIADLKVALHGYSVGFSSSDTRNVCDQLMKERLRLSSSYR